MSNPSHRPVLQLQAAVTVINPPAQQAKRFLSCCFKHTAALSHASQTQLGHWSPYRAVRHEAKRLPLSGNRTVRCCAGSCTRRRSDQLPGHGLSASRSSFSSAAYRSGRDTAFQHHPGVRSRQRAHRAKQWDQLHCHRPSGAKRLASPCARRGERHLAAAEQRQLQH